jgi:hypothetical protein
MNSSLEDDHLTVDGAGHVSPLLPLGILPVPDCCPKQVSFLFLCVAAGNLE